MVTITTWNVSFSTRKSNIVAWFSGLGHSSLAFNLNGWEGSGTLLHYWQIRMLFHKQLTCHDNPESVRLSLHNIIVRGIDRRLFAAGTDRGTLSEDFTALWKEAGPQWWQYKINYTLYLKRSRWQITRREEMGRYFKLDKFGWFLTSSAYAKTISHWCAWCDASLYG